MSARAPGLLRPAVAIAVIWPTVLSGAPARAQDPPLTAAQEAPAEEAPPRAPIRLEEIVVLASPLPQDLPAVETPGLAPDAGPPPPPTVGPDQAGVTTAGRAEIEQQGARTVVDVLDPLLAIGITGNSRGERVVSVRGFDPRDTVVLLDGVPIYIPYDGLLNLDLLPADMIDHVTLVAGPGSVVWGPNGMGGAINIVTRRPGEGPAARTYAEVGGRGEASRVGALHAMRAGPVAWVLEGGVEAQAGFPLSARFMPARNEDGGDRENSDRTVRRLLGNVEADLGEDQRLRLSGFVIDATQGIPPSTVAADARVRWWRMTSWQAVGASIGHSGTFAGGLQIDELVWARSYDNLIDSYDDDRYATQQRPRAFHTWYHDRSYGGRVRLSYPFSTGEWASVLRAWTGVQHDRHREDDGADLDRTLLTLAPQFEQALTRACRLAAGFQVDVEFPGEAPDVSLDTTVGWGPLLSVRYEPLDELSIEVVAARRSRFPTLKERFSYALGQRDPNPSLGPESAWHFEIEVAGRPFDWLELRAAGHDAEVDDLIAAEHVDSMVDQLRNVGSARMAGAELQLGIEPLEWLRLEAAYRYLYTRRLDTGPRQDVIPYRPEHAASFGLRLTPWPWLAFSTHLRLTGPQRFENPETLEWATLGSYVAWDARIESRLLPWFKLWVRATNLLDSDYQTEYGFPAPGWQLWVGLQVTCASFDAGCEAGGPSDG